MKKICCALLSFSVLATSFTQLSSQNDIPRASDKYFISNATVVPKPGIQLPNTSILLEDGIITDVGKIAQPYDAIKIEADSLYVYAGFIAGLSHVGLQKPEQNNNRPKVDRTGYPPNDIAGITPEKGIRELYKSNHNSIQNMRKAGFTISHSVPYGLMMPGKGSVISLNGMGFHDAVIKEDISLFAQWKPARRVFPGTIIGIMAKWRELYTNASHANLHSQSYDKNPSNKSRPDHDAATEGLFDVVDKKIPVFFAANKNLNIHRALQLQSDLGFDLMVSEIQMGHQTKEKIKKQEAGVLLSLDLPMEVKEKEGELGEEKKTLVERKKAAIKDAISQSADFSEDGLPFAYSFLEVRISDIHSNLKRIIDQGLSHNDALAALTTQAADALDIAQMAGTIEPGKLAHLVLSTGPVFEEKSKIKMVFVDGMKYEYDTKEKKKSKGDSVADLAGSWAFEVEDIPDEIPTGVIMLKKESETYTGTMTSTTTGDLVINLDDVSVDGSTMTFSFTIPIDGSDVTIETKLNFKETTFDGEIAIPALGTFPMIGEKKDPN